jgi:signal peptidase I
MDAENQTPPNPPQPDPNQPDQGTTLPSSPLAGGTNPVQHPLDMPAPKAGQSLDGLQTPTATPVSPAPTIREERDDNEPQAPSQLSSIAQGFSSVFGAIFSWIIFPVIVVLILHNFVFQAYHVLGTSMVPTLHESDYLIISKLGYTQALVERTFGKNKVYIPARGEVVVFRYPKDPSKVFVKRVIGLPGERVVIKNGTVTVYNKANPNGFNPDKNYEKSDTQTLIDTDEVVQEGNIFVMGDNRTPGGSYDSREWGELPSSYIIGNAFLRLLPLDQVRVL